ncbi:MAG: hypothetical protein HYT61_01200 [Candidatus Yanofskybacteria bacterium]|nr:hypothetical protein [Candidatus Yanofskybacteria bacterium]
MFLAKDIRKLEKLNTAKDNIAVFETPYPVFNELSLEKTERKMVIFMGLDFRLFPDLDQKNYIDVENKCLDYVRKECADCDLYYKPHPAEKDEQNFLNLASFKSIDDPSISEFFIMKNLCKIQYVFSPFSWISVSAYAMGLNSFVFSKLFKTAMGEARADFYDDYFKEMPPQFFINNFDQKLIENKRLIGKGELFEKEIKNALTLKKGAAWFVIADPGFLPIIIAMTRLIKSIDPERGREGTQRASASYGVDPSRKTNLIIVRHNRWDKMNIEEIRPYFDGVHIFKRTFYSLRPRKIFDAVKIAFSAKKLPIGSEGIIFGFTHSGFLENCLISYNKGAMKISCQNKLNLEWMYSIKRSATLSDDKFHQIKSNILYNRILEPLLGLNKTLYLKYGDGTVLNISRYEKPLNDVYDKVYLFENAKF